MTSTPDPGSHDALRSELLRLELALAERREADLPGGYARTLDRAFRETGASGRLWTREATLEALSGAEPTSVVIEGFEIEPLAESVVLATYSTAGARAARRASIWILADGHWRIRYHQGTLR